MKTESLKCQSDIFKISYRSDVYRSVQEEVKASFLGRIFRPRFLALSIPILLCSIFLFTIQNGFAQPVKVFRAGAATSNITPKIGTSINGNMKDVIVRQIHDETHARCIVLDDGKTKLVMLTVDLCMIYREELDAAKRRAYELTGIPVENMMMSAIHTHSGGTACSVFQSDPDPEYLKFLRERIADAVVRAE